jgi:proteasome lid subunit RPN8/RPN11
MTPVRLPDRVRSELIAHARDEAPNECCGLLIGRGTSIDQSVRAANLASSPATRYLLDPADHVATIRRLRGSDRTIVGAYHSHPASPAVPSATDRAEAFYPDFIWVIVSLVEPAGEVAAFRVDADRAEPIAIVTEAGSSA